MLNAIFLLLACQLSGEALHRLTGVPLPGAVVGMVLLLIWLSVRRRERPALTVVTAWLTAHLTLMFVPAAVGVMEQGAVLSRYGLALVAATVVSTALTMIVTALVFRWAVRRFSEEDVA